MKIGFSAFTIDQGRSGIGAYVLSLLKALRPLPIDIEVYGGKRDDEILSSCGFPVKSSADWVLSPLWNILWHQLMLKGVDVVHIPTIRRIPALKRCPITATVHDMAPLRVEGKYDRARTFYHRHFLTRLVKNCDRITTVSASTKRDLLHFTSYPEEKIEVIYPGVDHTMFFPLEGSKKRLGIKEPFFVYVSRLEHPGKNHIRLIEGFEIFKEKTGAPHQLILAGADWKGAEVIHEKIARSSYRKDIRLLGYVSYSTIVDLYRGAEKMIYPSLYEGFGLPVIEAMACGTTVACADSSSLTEIAKGHAYLFDPLNPEEIAHALMQPPLPSECTYAKTFDWSYTAKKMLQFWNFSLS